MLLSRAARPLSSTARYATLRSSVTPAVSVFRSFSSAQPHVESSSAPKAAVAAVAPSKQAETKTPFVSTPTRKYQFFQNVEMNDSGVAIVRFDGPGSSVNTISFQAASEAKTLWDTDIKDKAKAVVFTSAKPHMFIAGADIFDIQSVENKQDLVPLIEDGLTMFQSWKDAGIPLIAAIDGPALGGGLEWALWCDYRICTDSSKTVLGLPEVKLGLLPGFGGTQRLHPLVGLQKACDMILTGKQVRPAQAKKMGLVDLVVAPQSLEKVAIASAEQMMAGTLKSKTKPKSWFNYLLEDTSLGRRVLWDQVQKTVQKNAGTHYPAPYKIMEAMQYGLNHPSLKYKKERELFAELAATPESEALIGLFDGTNQIKKQAATMPDVENPQTVAVLGAGLMGAGIAQVSAPKYKVLLKDRNDTAVGKGVSYMVDNWQKKVSRKRMTDYQKNVQTSNVVPLTDTDGWQNHFAKTDVIIEAVFEDLTLKRQIVADMEAATPDSTIFATNTSAIPIADIAAEAKRPEQIIGMHYFSPVPNMPLLEIIPHKGTSAETIATAFKVGTQQGKTCIVVQDVPGFYVNRCLGPYLVEVSALIRDGVGLEKLDKSMRAFGMPVGPITLADEVGVDVTAHVAKFLSEADLGVRMSGGDVQMMQTMVDKGWLGKKSGMGFYSYADKKKKVLNPEIQKFVDDFATQKLDLTAEQIQDRIVSRYVVLDSFG